MVFDIQRASIWKRFAAWLLDVILLSILAAGVAFLLSLAFGYDAKLEAYQSIISEAGEKHGVDLSLSEQEIEALPEDVKARYAAAYDDLNSNDEALRLLTLTVNLSLVITTAGILASYLILEFFLPLFVFKNGRTIGKKVFSLALVRNNGVRINGPVLFIRTVLGKYAVETMIAAYIVIMFLFGRADLIMIILFFLVPVINLILLFATRNHTPIHDLLAGTVLVDFESQMIFDTEEDLIEYKKKVHGESVENLREHP